MTKRGKYPETKSKTEECPVELGEGGSSPSGVKKPAGVGKEGGKHMIIKRRKEGTNPPDARIL